MSWLYDESTLMAALACLATFVLILAALAGPPETGRN